MNIKFIEYDGISGYARVMYNDVKEADKYHTEVAYEGKDIKALLEYLFELEERNKKLNNILDKINRLFDADTHCENIYHAIGVVLNKEYFDIEDVWEEELLNILNGDDKE